MVISAYEYLSNGLGLSPSASGGSKVQNGGSQHETPELAFIAAAECRRASSPVLETILHRFAISE
jgi:hypothetical protein